MERADYIGIMGACATLFGVWVTWFLMKRQYSSKKLVYSYDVEPILLNRDGMLAQDIKVTYKGQELSHPMLISIDIANIGLAAVENAEIFVKIPSASYLIPGYFVDVPSGYNEHWNIESKDFGICKISFNHINPKQVSQIRLLISEELKNEPEFSCPMANVEFKKGTIFKLNAVGEIVLQLSNPQLYDILYNKIK